MLIVLLTNRKDYELFLSDVVFAFDGLEKFGFAEGGFYHLTNMAEKNYHGEFLN